MACDVGHASVVRLLLGQGANVHKSDSAGTTPLAIACYRGNLGVAGLLLRAGARPEAVPQVRSGTPTPAAVALPCMYASVSGGL